VIVWVTGAGEQKRKLAALIKNRGQVALAYHEKAHGSDMLSNEVEAKKVSGGYLISGEKWLVSNATRGAALTLFARTGDRGGPRDFSLFLIEKAALDRSSYTHLPKLKTHGVRGADLSGIRFDDCFIPADSAVGAIGSGLDISLTAFQVTRTIVPALSLGTADTALRVGLSFAVAERRGRDAVFTIPYARRTLVDAFLDLLICDCVATSAARGLHTSTEQMRPWSSLAKYYIPAVTQQMIGSLSVLPGAQYYLREGLSSGIFQKILRDNAVVSVFHAGAFLNLMTIALHLKCLAYNLDEAKLYDVGQLKESLEATFSLDKSLPAFDPKRLLTWNRGRDDILQGIELSSALTQSLSQDSDFEPELLAILSSLTSDLLAEVKDQFRLWRESESRYGPRFNESPMMYELAKRFCRLYAAACCLHMWISNRGRMGEFFDRGEWLALSLDRTLRSMRPNCRAAMQSYRENMGRELCRLYREDRLFSITPLRLARAAGN
jgi:alkylation response protein AidB-like acyl-CoA dehydrogenase